jgi:hypothetical protein
MINPKLKVLFALGLLISLSLSLPTLVTAQSNDPLQERISKDDSQTQAEADKLDELQRADYDECTAEANGNSQTPGSSGDGPSQSNPNDPQAQQTADEQATRDKLKEAGFDVNNPNGCDGMTYQQYQAANGKSCTDVAGLPQHSIDRLGEIYDEAGCTQPVTITGGTEGGHSTHGVGKIIVDLERGNAQINTYINNHTVNTWSSSHGTYHQLDNGDLFLDEGNHWHADLRGKTGSGGTMVNNWLGHSLAKLKSVFAPIVEAVSASGQIEIGGTLINLNTVSNNDLGDLINGLGKTDVNNLFRLMSQGNLETMLNKLPFDALNGSLGLLSKSTVNKISGVFSGGGLDDFAMSLADETMDGLLGNLSSSNLNSLILNTGGEALDLVMGHLGADTLDKVFGQLSSGLINDVMGELGVGAINNVLGNLGGDMVNQVVNGLGLTSLNTTLSNLGLTNMNTLVSNLTSGTLESILPNLGTAAATQLLGGTMPDILNKALSGVSETAIAAVAEAVPADLVTSISSEVPIVGTVLDSAGLSDLGGLAGAGLYVPVVEQNGQLMTHTGNIDDTTKEIKDLSVQICTHLKAIHRIQARFELEMVQKAVIDRMSSSEIEKYRGALDDALKKGYVVLDENGEEKKENGLPLYVTDNQSYLENAAYEAGKIALDNIAQNNNSNNPAIFAALQSEDSFSITAGPSVEDVRNVLGIKSAEEETAVANRNPLDNIPIVSTLLRPFSKVLAKLTGNTAWAQAEPTETDQTIDPDQFWNSFIRVVETNPGVQYLRARGEIEQAQNAAVLAARDTAAQGQGFLPVRTCLAKTSDGKTCTVWGIIQPGSIVKETAAASFNSRLTQYENADSMGDIAQGNEPNVKELLTMTPTIEGGGAPGPGMVEASQIPQQAQEELGSNPDTNNPEDEGDNPGNEGEEPGDGGEDPGDEGEEPGGFDWTNFMDLFDGIINNGGSSSDFNLLQLLIQLLSDTYKNQKPLVQFKAKDLGNDKSLLYWVSPNATDCKAGNDWLSQTETDSTTPKASGDSVGKYDNLTITYPSLATTSPTVTYKINCQNAKGTTAKSVTIEKQQQ